MRLFPAFFVSFMKVYILQYQQYCFKKFARIYGAIIRRQKLFQSGKVNARVKHVKRVDGRNKKLM